jgi:hypothetical protein
VGPTPCNPEKGKAQPFILHAATIEAESNI